MTKINLLLSLVHNLYLHKSVLFKDTPTADVSF